MPCHPLSARRRLPPTDCCLSTVGCQVARAESESVKNWDRFYKRNSDRFFKDRHYLPTEFQHLTSDLSLDTADPSSPPRRLLEVGCGVGNALFPLRDIFPALTLLGCDASKNAIALIHQRLEAENKEDGNGGKAPLDVWVQDIVTQPFPPHTLRSVDYVTLIFVLSAISPLHHPAVLRSIRQQLLPGRGVLYLRDYARLDMAQMRFQSSAVLDVEGFYIRADGTRTFFFELERLVKTMEEGGWEVLEKEVVERRLENRKEKLEMRRRFVQIKARARAEEEKVASDEEEEAKHTDDVEVR